MNFNDAFNEQERRIISGFLALMAEKPYAKITVKEIAERCAIARTTFYRSFEDTYELLERIERYLLGEFVLYRPRMERGGEGAEEPEANPYGGIEGWFATGLRLRFLLRPIMGPNGDLYFKERLIARVRLELNQMMDDELAPNDSLRPYYVAAIAAAHIGLLNHIASVDCDDDLLTPAQVAGIANSMRIAYFRSDDNAPPISDEQLFGR